MSTKTKMKSYAIGAILSIFVLPFGVMIILPSGVSDLTLTLTCIIVTAIPVIYCFVQLIKCRKQYDKELAIKELKNQKKRNKEEYTDIEKRDNNPVSSIIGLFVGIAIVSYLLHLGVGKLGTMGVIVLIVAGLNCLWSIINLLVLFQDYMDKTDNNE